MRSSWKFDPLTSASELEVHSTTKSNQRVYTVKPDVYDPPSPYGRFDSPPPPHLNCQRRRCWTWTRATCRPWWKRRPSASRCPQSVGIPLSDRPIIDFVRGVTLNYWHRRAASISAEISSLILAAAKFEFLKIELCTRVKVLLLIPSLRGFQDNLKNNAGTRRGWLFEVLLRI